jgi:hypothetical protein
MAHATEIAGERRHRSARRRAPLAATMAVFLGAALASCSSGSPPRSSRTSSTVIALASLSCPKQVASTSVASISADQALDNRWASYLDSGTGWTGGDSVYTYSLGSEGILFTFADSFLRGLRGIEHRRKLIYHNMFVVQGAGGFRVVTGGTPADPAPLVTAPYGKDFYLALGGSVDGSVFQAIFMERVQTGPGSLDNSPIGSVIATFSLPGLELQRVAAVPDPSGAIQWGAYVHRFGAWTYIYGASANGLDKRGYVARVAGDDLQQPWSYWNGRSFVADPSQAAPIASGVQSEYGVAELDGMYVLVTSDASVPFSPRADLYVGCSPVGPWTRRDVFTLSSVVGKIGAATWGNPDVYVYDAMVQPALSSGSTLVVSYDRNSLELPAVLKRADIYMPSYLEISLAVPHSA